MSDSFEDSIRERAGLTQAGCRGGKTDGELVQIGLAAAEKAYYVSEDVLPDIGVDPVAYGVTGSTAREEFGLRDDPLKVSVELVSMGAGLGGVLGEAVKRLESREPVKDVFDFVEIEAGEGSQEVKTYRAAACSDFDLFVSWKVRDPTAFEAEFGEYEESMLRERDPDPLGFVYRQDGVDIKPAAEGVIREAGLSNGVDMKLRYHPLVEENPSEHIVRYP